MKTVKMKFFWVFLLLPLFLICKGLVAQRLSTSPTVNLYVSPKGDDTNPGTLKRPFKTIEKAKQVVGGLLKTEAKQITVNLRGGRYALQQTLTFNQQDARVNCRVVYQAYPGEKPVLSGGQKVLGWTLHNAGQNIYKAFVGHSDFRQLYINGKAAVRARQPNKENETDFGPYFRLLRANVQKQEFTIALKDWDAAKSVTQKEAMELVVLPHWIHQNVRYKSHEVDGDSVRFIPEDAERTVVFNKNDNYYRNAPFYYENAYEFIDKPGEWYLDKVKGILYFKAEKDADIRRLDFEIPVLDVLIEVVGTQETPVQNLEFRGLTFECTNWTSPSEVGLSATQFVLPYGQLANRTFVNRAYPQAVFKLMNAQHVIIRGNVIRNAGANAIVFFANVDNSPIVGNTLTNIAANGIVIDAQGKKNAKPEEQSDSVVIVNNSISKCGQVYTNGGGVLAYNVHGMTIEHNEIFDMPYSGIQVGDQPAGYADMGCYANLIRFNHIHHCLQLHDDGGGIYTLGGNQRGTRIEENYLHDIKRSQWAGDWYVEAIYLDNYSQFIRVANNVVYNADVGGQYNHAQNNEFNTNGLDIPKKAAIIANAGVKVRFKSEGNPSVQPSSRRK
ncbi:right-handed parallel beta-helix repeat-containing protein [Spirosoma aerolatum]|uniref:right-handed parallel beta-helix repeat-containing protein n=1 Tax=Spirosoma aerolatum TaxID=1211326 RepID=UPI0014732C29|nr:right-handed parallel beta-helix repeat-containing protein [Spirosoma aerolatum]